jgi:hypothetical protein
MTSSPKVYVRGLSIVQRPLCITAIFSVVAACSGSDATSPGPGGTANTGGSTAVGSSQTGGKTAAAGSGVVSTGGSLSGTGGTATVNGAGGASAAGGVNATGGMNPTGGVNATGGAVSAGGATVATGGKAATGGTATSGAGTKATGGATASTGGSPPTGGAPPTTGGSKASGGSTANGGTKATAGASATGGTNGSGGTTGTGGSSWPQCFSNDTVPTTTLKQRAPTSDYTTQVAYGGIAMIIGQNRQSCLTDSLVNFDVQDLNGEVKDIVETLQFPGFLDWARGYYMNWVILNSGIPNATLSGQGGHQGDRYGHMNFESTEECPCNWGTGDNSNRGNALHESIHALQAELWAFNNQASGWIHEAHNCYLGTQRTHFVENQYTMGWGAALALQMPHVPIESMGLLTDDTVAGPADQLASGKTYVNSIVRYGLEIFFLDLNLEMGRGFVNCLWIDGSKAGKPDSRISSTLSVFQALQSYAGADGAAHAVMSFGARSAILDFAGWTAVVRQTVQGNWNNGYWFYMYPGGDGTTTFRPVTKQIPHHQGRNIIPIKVNSGATSVTVEFTPDAAGDKGTAEHMQAQLVYRDSSDQPVYGTIFSSGQNTIQIPNGARNGIVNLVVAVTNANAASGGDDGSNKGFNGQEHFNYQARIVSGGVVAPNTTRPW